MGRLAGVRELNVEDLFAAGVGFDFTGAVLLGRGLMAKPPRIAREAATWWGHSATAAGRMIRDKVDGQAGLLSLALGFFLQLVGIAAVVDGHRVTTGREAAGVAFLIGLAAIGFSWAAWASTKRRFKHAGCQQVVLAAREAGIAGARTCPLDLLKSIGEGAGFAEEPDETAEHYAARVFPHFEIPSGEP